MKTLLAVVLVTMMAGVASAKTCEDCPPRTIPVVDTDGNTVGAHIDGGTCWATEPAGDGCNTCSFETWCINGEWYRSSWANCTLMGCSGGIKLPGNPTE